MKQFRDIFSCFGTPFRKLYRSLRKKKKTADHINYSSLDTTSTIAQCVFDQIIPVDLENGTDSDDTEQTVLPSSIDRSSRHSEVTDPSSISSNIKLVKPCMNEWESSSRKYCNIYNNIRKFDQIQFSSQHRDHRDDHSLQLLSRFFTI